VAEIADTSLAASLREIILARETSVASVKHSNVGGWQSGVDFFDWAGEAGARLERAARELADHYSGERVGDQLVKGSVVWRVAGWANINRRGHANAQHAHPGSFWSAVFYVDDGGINGEKALGGAIEFSDPRGALAVMYAPHVRIAIPHCHAQGEQFYPKTGTLLMFPAWLPHRVTEYRGDAVRISVAMNFNVVD
jgi:uncharacterized protein (TIGR02466 family)